MSEGANRPFRWDLVRRDQLGSLLEGQAEPDLWFVAELERCAARVVARSGDGELYFVGRSPDSVFDLLSGLLADTGRRGRIHQLPLSLYGLDGSELAPAEVRQLRANLEAEGLAPYALMRGRPVVFADLVHHGSTFENLYRVLREWIDDENAQWDVIRLQLRFLGITWRGKTSPNAWRWQQQAGWTADLPARAIRNVSLDGGVWSYLGDFQPKTAASFRRTRWADPQVAEPARGDRALAGLAEAVALVEHGRDPEVRRRFARLLGDEPAIRERWLRDLQADLLR